MKFPSLKTRLLLAVLLAGVAAWFFLFPREPSYQGKSLNFWFKKYCHSLSPAREEALETIAEIGGDAVPYLSRLLKKSDSIIERAYRSARLKLPDPVQRWLPRPIEPRRLRADAMACLTRLGWSFNTAAGPLIEATRHSDPDTRTLAVQALRDFGPRTSAIVTAVLAVAKDTDARIRAEALSVLSDFSHSARDKTFLKPAIPTLLGALADPEWMVRFHAIQALKALGPEAREAILPLSLILKGHDQLQELSFSAADALLHIDPSLAESIAPILLRTLSEIKEGNIMPVLIHALIHIGPKARDAIPELIQLLKSQNSSVRLQAISALGQMGETAKEAIPALIPILADRADMARTAAATALSRIDPGKTKQAVASLLDDLRLGSVNRSTVMSALGNMRTDAREAIPRLRDTLSDADPFLRLAAGEALRQIDPNEAPSIIPVYLDLLDRRDIPLPWRPHLVRWLGEMGLAALPVVPGLIELLKHRDRKTQLAAAEGLLRIDEKQTATVVSFLTDYLKRKDYWDREQAAEMLGKLGPAAKPAAAALKAATMDADEKVRASAIKALLKIER